DGIRDFHVTGVQTCALPISRTEERLQAGRGQEGDGELGSRIPCKTKGGPIGPPFRFSIALFYPPLPPITARTVLSGPKSSALSKIGRASCRERADAPRVGVQ